MIMNTELKDKLSVLVFPAEYFSWSEIAAMTDDEKREFAEDNDIYTTVFDSLSEFQLAVNEDSVDVSQSFIFFVPNCNNAITAEKLDNELNDIKNTYQCGDVCMAEVLASHSADGMTVEIAFNLYVKAMNWADGDTFYVTKSGDTKNLV